MIRDASELSADKQEWVRVLRRFIQESEHSEDIFERLKIAITDTFGETEFDAESWKYILNRSWIYNRQLDKQLGLGEDERDVRQGRREAARAYLLVKKSPRDPDSSVEPTGKDRVIVFPEGRVAWKLRARQAWAWVNYCKHAKTNTVTTFGTAQKNGLLNRPDFATQLVEDIFRFLEHQETDPDGASESSDTTVGRGFSEDFGTERKPSQILAEGLHESSENSLEAPAVVPNSGPAASDVQRLLAYSRSYVGVLEQNVLGGHDRNLREDNPADAYIVRDIEADLLAKIRSGDVHHVLIDGEAGHGKSSLLWHISSILESGGHPALVVSATWLLAAGDQPPLLSPEDIVEALSALSNGPRTPILLFDTADVLLHTQNLIMQTQDLIRKVIGIGAQIIATVRPREKSRLRELFSTHITLTHYSDGEMEKAVLALMRRNLPQLEPSLGIELIRQAHTRGLPMLDILRSPLLSGILFELSNGDLPGLDLDVTGLYQRYWNHRVRDDMRNNSLPSHAQDLRPIAGYLGLAMLIEAIPELDRDVAENLIEEIKDPQKLPHGTPGQLSTLSSRGVVVLTDSRYRFPHQTLFEFAAAQGLRSRGGAKEIRRLTKIMIDERPHDLFTGAVLEQLLILSAKERHLQPVVGQAIAALLASDNHGLRTVAVIGWVHLPGADIDSDRFITGLDEDSVNRLVNHLPQVQHRDPWYVTDLLRKTWRYHRETNHRKIIECIHRFSLRFPAQIVELCRDEEIVGYTMTYQRRSLHKPRYLIDLILALTDEDPAYVKRQIMTLMKILPQISDCAKLYELMTTLPSLIQDAEFSTALERTGTEIEHRFSRSSHTELRLSAARFFHAHIAHAFAEDPVNSWYEYAQKTLNLVGPRYPNFPLGVRLFSIVIYCSQQTDTAYLRRLLTPLFNAEPINGPLYIDGPFLRPILCFDAQAALVVHQFLEEKLRNGLPTSQNTEVTGAQSWAMTARTTLSHPDIPAHLNSRIHTQIPGYEPSWWTHPHYLMSLLPSAARGGNTDAKRALRSLVQKPESLDPSKRRALLKAAALHHELDEEVAEATVSLMIQAQALGSLKTLSNSYSGRVAICRHLDTILDLISRRIYNTSSSETAIDLWQTLLSSGIVTCTNKQVTDALSVVRSPKAKSALVRILPEAVTGDTAAMTSALAQLVKEVPQLLPDATEPTVTQNSHVVNELIDSARISYRGILAMRADPTDWDVFFSLVKTPRKAGSTAHQFDTNRYIDVRVYLASLLTNKETPRTEVLQHLVVAASFLASDAFTPQQQKSASKYLSPPAKTLLNYLSPTESFHALKNLNSFPSVLAETLISHQITGSGAPDVERLLANGELKDNLVRFATKRLRTRREAGFHPLTELREPPQ
ncbi:ATP-binding protein [Nesterenkonia muleiensis]|uniref:ATP-binding protein n=1 Tax=Nesterenkonia muleiensis TaxID=2282648 RepID=UPI000E71D964|nr:ATP-binding protein [Nesterenkonia muleiensis]